MRKFEPYIRLQEGISFINYNKEDQASPGKRTFVKEQGFYGYAGAGTDFNLNKKLGLFLETGIKSFHISGNDLDVNPHGINGKIGLKYAFR